MVLATSVFFPEAAESQNVQFDYDEFNTRHGLSHNLVTSIVQDKRGFLWFGTEEGLNRFDGFEFRVYKHRENDPSSLISNSIRTLFVDDDGLIWIGTSNGLCRLNPVTDHIEHFTADFTDETKLNGAYISSIRKKEDGSIWISYIGSGIDIIFPGQENIFHYTIHRNDQYTLKSDMVSSFQFMPDGTTIIGTYDGLQFLDREGNVLPEENAQRQYLWKDKVGKNIQNMLLSRNRQFLWIGTEFNGLYRINLLTQEVRNFNSSNSELESNSILTLTEDSFGKVWAGSDAVYYFDEGSQNFVWYNGHGMYIKSHTHVLFEDKDQNLWMGTSRLGVRKVSLQESPVRHFHSNQGEGSIKSDEVLSFQEDENHQMWVGTGGTGLFKLMDDQKSFEESPVNRLLLAKTIKCIYKDREGFFWLGSWDGGFAKYHPVHHTFKAFHPDLGNFQSRHVWDIKGDHEGNLWLGTLRDGLAYFNTKTNEYKYYQYIPGDSTALVNNDIQSLLVDSRNILWVGTANGLSVLFPGSEQFSNFFKFKSNEKNTISNSVIFSIFEDSNGKIWLGTKGGGITIVSIKNNKVIVEKTIRETNGLPSNTVASILEDDQKNMWVSTSEGIAKIKLRDFSVEETSHISGLQGTEFLPSAAYKSTDGKLFFGGSNGFNMFSPASLPSAPETTDVWFTNLKIINDDIVPGKLYRDRTILEKSITETKELNLTHEDYAFTINFSPLEYNGQNNIRYSYMLENLDKEWQSTNSERRFVHYTNLEPGNYTLKVKASFDGKNWPEQAQFLNITVAPPWWANIWFRIGVSLMFVGTTFILYKGRVKFLENQRIKLEELVSLRTSELKKSNKEIQSLLEEVALQKSSIENKNTELWEKNEEVISQCEILEEKGQQLENAHKKLREINTSLEEQVSERTRSLNNTLHELETFLYRASHDLKGPISSMQGLIALALMERDSGQFNEQYTRSLQVSAKKLERILHKLLEKYTIQKAELLYENFSKADICRFLESSVLPQINGFRKSDFNISIEEDIFFESDQKLLSIILLNLLENAFFYSSFAENKQVDLHFKQEDNRITIVVQNYGPGIKPEVKDKVFNMFYRGNELSTGNGLGLYLVKSAAERLNGTTDLESELYFTSFKVVLPAYNL